MANVFPSFDAKLPVVLVTMFSSSTYIDPKLKFLDLLIALLFRTLHVI